MKIFMFFALFMISSSLFSQTTVIDTLREYQFETYNVLLLREQGLKKIIYSDSTKEVILLSESEAKGSKFQLSVVKTRNNLIGVATYKRFLYSYLLFEVNDDSTRTIKNLFILGDPAEQTNYRLLDYNTVMAIVYQKPMEDVIYHFLDDGTYREFKVTEPAKENRMFMQ